jgi:hypothetical protein
VKRVVLGLVLGIVTSGCIVRHWGGGPHLTGTCSGACAHYIECKPGHPERDRARCETECPGVFADRDSLMMYENLSCKDAVEYVDGTAPRSASSAR